MINSYFFLIADRGNVKAYRAEKTPANRPPQVRLVQALTLVDAHLRPRQKFTDQEGAFPVADGSGGGNQGRHQNSIAERHFEIEETRRLVKQIAGHIETILAHEKPDCWSFAAPPEIHQAVVDQIELKFRELLAESVMSNLVNVPPAQILEHFHAVCAAP